MNKKTLYLVVVFVIIVIIILLLKKQIKTILNIDESYGDYDFLFPRSIPRQLTGGLQYAMLYPDAIEDQNFPPSIEGCTQFCKKLNTGIIEQAMCMDSCMHTSGYIPRLDMLTNKQDLVDNL
jgi:hypothetical protein